MQFLKPNLVQNKTCSSGPRPTQQPASLPSRRQPGRCEHRNSSLGGCLGLVHVMNHDLVRRTGNPFDEFDRFLACGTSCTENFDFLPCSHGVLLKNLLDSCLRQLEQTVASSRCPGEAMYSRAKRLPVVRSLRTRYFENSTQTCLAERRWPRVLH